MDNATCTDSPQLIPAIQATAGHGERELLYLISSIMSGPGLIIEKKVIEARISSIVSMLSFVGLSRVDREAQASIFSGARSPPNTLEYGQAI